LWMQQRCLQPLGNFIQAAQYKMFHLKFVFFDI